MNNLIKYYHFIRNFLMNIPSYIFSLKNSIKQNFFNFGALSVLELL
jgi:hypothetical protein